MNVFDLAARHRPGVSVMMVCIALFLGCSKPASNTGPVEPQTPLPKLDFHKPADFESAIARIVEIHIVLTSHDDLPEPISYTVREVSHSHGSGQSHVHYELVGQHEHDHQRGDHDHSQSGDDATEHEVVVGVFTELADIVRWLPAIAADSDMAAEEWKRVEETAERISGQLEPIGAATSPRAQQEAYKAKSGVIESSIETLEALAKSSGNGPA